MLSKIDFNSESLKREFKKCAALCPLVRLGDYSDGESATYEVLSSMEEIGSLSDSSDRRKVSRSAGAVVSAANSVGIATIWRRL